MDSPRQPASSPQQPVNSARPPVDPPRRAARTRSIRLLLALLLIVPLVSLLALWVFAASVTLSSAIQERNFNTQDNTIGAPGEALAWA